MPKVVPKVPKWCPKLDNVVPKVPKLYPNGAQNVPKWCPKPLKVVLKISYGHFGLGCDLSLGL